MLPLMLRSAAVLLSLLLLPTVLAQPRIAIVIDDLGHHVDHHAFTELQLPVTLAIMPFTMQAEALAAAAADHAHEVVIHMPMQREQHDVQEQGVLDRFDSKAQFIATLAAAFSRLPNAKGLNNHQGSQMTAAAEQMNWLMAELQQRGLYFLDSRTTAATVAEQTAQQWSIPTNRRHVFLDNEPTLKAIEAQWQRAVLIAQNQGYAIVIGHPYEVTLEFLQQLQAASVQAVELVYLSALVSVNSSPAPSASTE